MSLRSLEAHALASAPLGEAIDFEKSIGIGDDCASYAGAPVSTAGRAREDEIAGAPMACRTEFFGLAFEHASPEEIAATIARRPAGAPFRYVVTPNVDHIVRLVGERKDLLPIYEAAWLRVCDSRVLRLLGRLRSLDLALVTGGDLIAALFDRFISPGDELTVIGGSGAAIETLRQRYKLTRLAHHNPPLGFIGNADEVSICVDFVLRHPARYVFLVVGSPQQEILAAAIAATGRGVGTGLCAGAALNYLTGLERRAPPWMQRACLEWLHRLMIDPRRMWRRYLVRGPRIFMLFLRHATITRSAAGSG